MFEKFLTTIYPEYLEQNPDFLNSLTRVRKVRNKFAHSVNPQNSTIREFVDKPFFKLMFVEEGSIKHEQIMWNDVKQRYADFEKIIAEIKKIRNITKEKKKLSLIDNTQQDSELQS